VSNPIPVKHRDEFIRWMRSVQESAPEVSHWEMLDAAEEFLIVKKFSRGDPHSAVQQYYKLVDAHSIRRRDE
jgi:hypothetical protein